MSNGDKDIVVAMAPEPFLNASLWVLHRAAVIARLWGQGNDLVPKQLEDLMDAIENVPWVIANWSNEHDRLLRHYFSTYDRLCPDSAFLLWEYEAALQGHRRI